LSPRGQRRKSLDQERRHLQKVRERHSAKRRGGVKIIRAYVFFLERGRVCPFIRGSHGYGGGGKGGIERN